MLQIIVVFYGPGLLFGMQVGNDYRFKAALIAFIINYSCYFSEIYRGGIESIPKGQQEAGLVLGMTKSQIFFKVTLLQVVKNIVPPMSNEIITLVKDTSLARTIAIIEVIRVGEDYITGAGLFLAALLHRRILPCILRNSYSSFRSNRKETQLF